MRQEVKLGRYPKPFKLAARFGGRVRLKGVEQNPYESPREWQLGMDRPMARYLAVLLALLALVLFAFVGVAVHLQRLTMRQASPAVKQGPPRQPSQGIKEYGQLLNQLS